jgi:hypothetical protein
MSARAIKTQHVQRRNNDYPNSATLSCAFLKIFTNAKSARPSVKVLCMCRSAVRPLKTLLVSSWTTRSVLTFHHLNYNLRIHPHLHNNIALPQCHLHKHSDQHLTKHRPRRISRSKIFSAAPNMLVKSVTYDV